jgi:hypothetical protein
VVCNNGWYSSVFSDGCSIFGIAKGTLGGHIAALRCHRECESISSTTKVLGCPGTRHVEYACGLPSLRAELTQTSNLGHFYARLSKHFLMECVQSQVLAGFTWRVVSDFPRIFPKFNCVQRAMIAPHDIKLGRQLGMLGTLHAARYSRR